MKKKIICVLTPLLCASLIPFAACGGGTNNSGNSGNEQSDTADIYASSAVSAVEIIQSEFGNTSKTAALAYHVADGETGTVTDETDTGETGSDQTGTNETESGSNETGGTTGETGGSTGESGGATTTTDEVKSQSDKFNEYYLVLTNYFSADKIKTATTQNTSEEYKLYGTKTTLTDAYSQSYTMYYNETLTNSKINSKKSKQVYVLEGVMVADGNEYTLLGERTYKEKKDETESEITLRAYPDKADLTTYIQMEHESENESNETEVEYTYSLYKSGTLVEQTKYSMENEQKGNKQEVEYEFEYKKDNEFGDYEITTKTEGTTQKTTVKYSIGTVSPKQVTESGEFEVKQTENGCEFVYSDNSTKEYKIKKQ